MDNNLKLLDKIYYFLDSLQVRANVQYANDGDIKQAIHHIFFEIDNFFLKLEEEIKFGESSI